MTGLRNAILSAILLVGGDIVPAMAAPTPLPGGANQVGGVSGTFSQVLFNGTLRVRKMSLRDTMPEDQFTADQKGERALIFKAIVSNGTHTLNDDFFKATLADADGITIPGRQLGGMWRLDPGAAARVKIGFAVPAGFVPTKLVLTEGYAPKPKVFRIAVGPADVAPVAAPAASP
ncbi:MAG: hypothetical protein NVS3B28_29200 [Candidatus Velthaea sp.]